MREISDILGSLAERGVRLSLSGDAVKIAGQRDNIAATELEELKLRKGELVAYLRAARTPKLARAPADLHGGRAPLTIFQRGWYDPDDAPDFVPLELRRTPVAFRLTGPFSPAAMLQAFRQLIGRHEALRTRYGAADGASYQEVLQHNDPVLRQIDLGALPGHQFSEMISAVVRADIGTPPAYNAGRPIRSWVFRRNDNIHVLAMVIDHIALDNRSMNIIIEELFSLYRCHAEGEPDQLPPVDLQYTDYAIWAQSHQSTERLAQNEAKWRDRFGDTRPVDLRARAPWRPAPGAGRGFEPINVDETTFDAACRFAQKNGLTLPIVMVAVVSALLSQWSGQPRVLFGGVVDGRPWQMHDTVGCFVRTSPLLIDLADDPTVRTLLARAKRAYIDANDAQQMGRIRAFPQLGHVSLNVQRKSERIPFAPRSPAMANGELGAIPKSATTTDGRPGTGPRPAVDPSAPPAKLQVQYWNWSGKLVDDSGLDLHVYLIERPASMSGYVLFAADRLDTDEVRRFACALPQVLAKMTCSPHVRTSDLLAAVRDDAPLGERAQPMAV